MNGAREQHGIALTLRNAAKTFQGGIKALQPIELEVPRGEILVLLGPSGCGKTTLLRIIAGLEQADRGASILFDGEDVTQTPIEKRQIGMVFQSYALFPNMSVAENIAYGLRVRGMPMAERQREVAPLLELVGLGEYSARRVDQLSGGQRQRVALARAMAIKPRILLLDEPLSALDAALRERLRIELAAMLRQFGITAIMVTHDQTEAMAIGDRIAVMRNGRIEQIGVPQVIYAEPSNRFVAQFVGQLNNVSAAALQMPAGPDLCFRPEAMHIVPHGEHAALIREVLFLGAELRIIADIAGQRIEASLPSGTALPPDRILRFNLDPSQCWRFPKED